MYAFILLHQCSHLVAPSLDVGLRTKGRPKRIRIGAVKDPKMLNLVVEMTPNRTIEEKGICNQPKNLDRGFVVVMSLIIKLKSNL